MRLCRYRHGDVVGYGLLEEDAVQPFEGDLFGQRQPVGESLSLADVQLLAPLARAAFSPVRRPHPTTHLVHS